MDSTPQLDRTHRARGALLGLAVGDAIGTTVEFKPRGSFTPLSDMVGGGPFSLQPGQWTDDTSMALCLATSLIDNGFDSLDQMQRYVLWHDEGYLSSTGKCFDIGNATYDALTKFKRTGDPVAGSVLSNSAGNGSIMRLAPVPIYYLDNPEQAIQMSSRQSRTTHQAPECLAACRMLGEALIRALQGKPKAEVLAPLQPDLKVSNALVLIAAGDYKTKTEAQIKGSGYVVESLEAAFWCFWQTNNFKDCVLQAANLGDDADTTAAIAGQLAGAYYGEPGIPEHWLQKLTMATEIGQMADRLAVQKAKT